MGGSIFARIRDGHAAAYAALTEPVFTIINMNTPPGKDREKSGRIVSQRGRKYKRCEAAQRLHEDLYHQLTRAHTPDSVSFRCFLSFSPRQKKLASFRFRLAAKAALCNLLLPFQIKPTSLGFDLIYQSYSPSASQKPKITQKSITVRCKQFCRSRNAFRQ